MVQITNNDESMGETAAFGFGFGCVIGSIIARKHVRRLRALQIQYFTTDDELTIDGFVDSLFIITSCGIVGSALSATVAVTFPFSIPVVFLSGLVSLLK